MNDYDFRVAKALEMARAKSGLSQEKLAKRMGISRPTVASKEQGTSAVTLAELIKWCVCCGVPAKRYTDACIHPGLLEYLDDDISAEEKRQILHGVVDDISNYEVDALLYLYYGDHGSDPLGVLTEVLANLHSPLCLGRSVVRRLSRLFYQRGDVVGQHFCFLDTAPFLFVLFVRLRVLLLQLPFWLAALKALAFPTSALA